MAGGGKTGSSRVNTGKPPSGPIDAVRKVGLEKIIARDLAVLRRLSGENALWKRLVKSLEDSLKARGGAHPTRPDAN